MFKQRWGQSTYQTEAMMMSDSSKNKKPEPDKEYVAKPRKCLMCRKEFTSAWAGERVCKDCKQTAAWNDSSLAA